MISTKLNYYLSIFQEESGNARSARSRIPGRRDDNYGLNGLRNIGNTVS